MSEKISFKKETGEKKKTEVLKERTELAKKIIDEKLSEDERQKALDKIRKSFEYKGDIMLPEEIEDLEKPKYRVSKTMIKNFTKWKGE